MEATGIIQVHAVWLPRLGIWRVWVLDISWELTQPMADVGCEGKRGIKATPRGWGLNARRTELLLPETRERWEG